MGRFTLLYVDELFLMSESLCEKSAVWETWNKGLKMSAVKTVQFGFTRTDRVEK